MEKSGKKGEGVGGQRVRGASPDVKLRVTGVGNRFLAARQKQREAGGSCPKCGAQIDLEAWEPGREGRT